jgi:hypothetical protein
VAGVRVGHATVSDGDSLRTGVTAIVPHRGDLFRDRVPAALHVGNGFGKLLGVTQLRELGELETPILLTCTLCIWQVGDAVAQWMLQKPENSAVRSINPVVGETNDGGLNATRVRPGIGAAAVRAIEMADTGSVTEGSVGRVTAPSCSDGRVASARRRVCCRRRLADTRSACWCKATMVACCRWRAYRLAPCSVATPFNATLTPRGVPGAGIRRRWVMREVNAGDGSCMIVDRHGCAHVGAES